MLQLQHTMYSQRNTAPLALATRLLAPTTNPGPARPPCPWPEVAAAVNASGGLLSSVKLFNDTLHTMTVTGPSEPGDGPAVRWAINASKLCGGAVFFPQGQYKLASTVLVPKQTPLLGAGAGSVSPRFPESPSIHFTGGPDAGPTFLAINAEKIRFENLVIVGRANAISVLGCALIRIVNCGVEASHVGTGEDAVNTSATGCVGCNVVLHSNNTAYLLVENTYWLWVEDSSFSFYPEHGANGPVPRVSFCGAMLEVYITAPRLHPSTWSTSHGSYLTGAQSSTSRFRTLLVHGLVSSRSFLVSPRTRRRRCSTCK